MSADLKELEDKIRVLEELIARLAFISKENRCLLKS